MDDLASVFGKGSKACCNCFTEPCMHACARAHNLAHMHTYLPTYLPISLLPQGQCLCVLRPRHLRDPGEEVRHPCFPSQMTDFSTSH